MLLRTTPRRREGVHDQRTLGGGSKAYPKLFWRKTSPKCSRRAEGSEEQGGGQGGEDEEEEGDEEG